MFTLCSNNNPDDCHEQAQQVWVAESTNALTIALEQCDIKAQELSKETTAYYRCVIEAEKDAK
jgi:hypothetical protein